MQDKTVNLNLDQAAPPALIHVTQGDTAWRWHFPVWLDGTRWTIPSGAKAILKGLKPDGHVFAYSGSIASNEVVVDCALPMTICAGPVGCTLIIMDSDNKRLHVARIALLVAADPEAAFDVASDSALPAYAELLSQYVDLGPKADAAIAAADEALVSKTAAASSATAAAGSATTATQQAQAAATARAAAETAKTAAATAQTAAEAARAAAASSATDAAGSATTATQQAQAAATARAAAETAQTAAETAASHYPKIVSNKWHVWDPTTGSYVDTGIIAKGATGDTGTTFTPSVSASGDLSWTNDGGKPNPQTVNIKGPKGDPGADGTVSFDDLTPEQRESLRGPEGDTGTTFTPSVSASGELSWTNDGGKNNPQTVNIMGPKGDTGDTGPAGPGVPAGGTDGNVLVKNGATDYDATWKKTPPQMGSLATIEPTSSASKAYAAGDYLIYNGQLYKVIKPISPQDLLNSGTNGNIRLPNNGGFNDVSKYTEITGVQTNVDFQLPIYAREVLVDCAFPGGQHISLYSIFPESGQTRCDGGFYYVGNRYGGGAVILYPDRHIFIGKPWYGGQELAQYDSIRCFYR